jgi:two-component system, sensor histidine kinase RegB
MLPDLEPKVTLPWLIRLRWLAFLGQLSAIAIAHFWFTLRLEWALLLPLVGVLALTNVALSLVVRNGSMPVSAAQLMGAVLMLDTCLLTALLAATGGSDNPFTLLYLVHIMLSAVALSARWTTLITLLSVTGFGLLFWLGVPEPHPHNGPLWLDHHLQGMWVAFVLAAALSGFFMRLVVQAIAVQKEEIAALREQGARNARLAALTTLAAGAAHELGSPLGTIAVAAHEVEVSLRKLPGAERAFDDLRLILLEVDRCQEILGQMAARASRTTDAASSLSVGELARKIADHLGHDKTERMDLSLASSSARLHVPGEPLAQCVAALVSNGIDASGPGGRVAVALAPSPVGLEIHVTDRGMGMAPDVLSKVGDPFFTTKQPGSGMGLGVFLARTFVESLGGALSIESTPGLGTRATLRVPSPRLPLSGVA